MGGDPAGAALGHHEAREGREEIEAEVATAPRCPGRRRGAIEPDRQGRAAPFAASIQPSSEAAPGSVLSSTEQSSNIAICLARKVECCASMTNSGGPPAQTPVPLHIERSDDPATIPETTDYRVSLGGSKDGVGMIELGTTKGVRTLRTFLLKLGVAPSEIEIACRVLNEQAHHEIPDVKLRPAALRDLGNT